MDIITTNSFSLPKKVMFKSLMSMMSVLLLFLCYYASGYRISPFSHKYHVLMPRNPNQLNSASFTPQSDPLTPQSDAVTPLAHYSDNKRTELIAPVLILMNTTVRSQTY